MPFTPPPSNQWSGPELPCRDVDVNLPPMRTARGDVRLSTVRVHANGVELALRGTSADTEIRDLGAGRFDPRHEFAQQARFEITLANGKRLGTDDSTGLKTGREPAFTVSQHTRHQRTDGRLRSEEFEAVLWLWPLPPRGPLTLTCSWPQIKLEGATFRLDADELVSLAEQLPAQDGQSTSPATNGPPLQEHQILEFDVPLLVGLTVSKARSIANALGFIVMSDDPDGASLGSRTWPGRWIITNQIPETGTKIRRGDVVTITFENRSGGGSGDREPRKPVPQGPANSLAIDEQR